jgi:hypothetical protein
MAVVVGVVVLLVVRVDVCVVVPVLVTVLVTVLVGVVRSQSLKLPSTNEAVAPFKNPATSVHNAAFAASFVSPTSESMSSIVHVTSPAVGSADSALLEYSASTAFSLAVM